MVQSPLFWWVNFAFHLEIKVPESGGRVERHRINVAWSPVWWFVSDVKCDVQSVMIWAAISSTGVGTWPHCQRYQKLVNWLWCYCSWLASKLAWPEPQREFMGYCQEKDERNQTQQCRWPEGRYQSNLGFHYTGAVPQADYVHATPHWCSNSCQSRPNQVLSA